MPRRSRPSSSGGSRARGDVQDELDATRHWAQARQFQIGLQVLLGLIDGAAAGVQPDRHRRDRDPRAAAAGRPPGSPPSTAGSPGGAFVVLGLGKLGSRELTIGSDLDLIFIFEADEDARSDGARPLPAATWLRPAQPAADPRADRADRRGAALRDRHAAAAVRQPRAGRLLARQLRALSADRRPDLGASGADPGARGGGRPGARRARRPRSCARALTQPRDPRPARARRRGDARADLPRARRPGPLEPQARPRRPDRGRVPRPVPAAALRARAPARCSRPARSRAFARAAADRRAAGGRQPRADRRDPALPAAAGGAAPVGQGSLRCRERARRACAARWCARPRATTSRTSTPPTRSTSCRRRCSPPRRRSRRSSPATVR